MTVETIYRAIDAIAPFANPWILIIPVFLIGNPQAAVSDVLICLDVTPRVLREALDCGAGLIISHHPVIFHKLGALLGEHAVCARSQRCLGDQRAYKPR